MVVTREFEAVFRTTFPRLVALGVMKTGRHDIARELAQETMLRAHQRWDEVGRYDSPEGWCRVVMTNLLVDHHRSAASERRATERLASPATVAAEPAAPDRWQSLVAPLNERQRLIVTLYYAEDWSVDEIAGALGTTTGGVKASLFKARRSLRRHLGGDGDG